MNISNNIDNIIIPNNKKLLWETLHTNGVFSNFKQEQLGNVKHIFDEEINVEYFNNVNNVNFNLLQSNRNIIVNIINKLNVLNNKNVNSVDNKLKEKEKEFNDLIINWTETSQKILLMLNNKHQIVTKNRNPKSIMALGAMGAHINMALQALKSRESDK